MVEVRFDDLEALRAHVSEVYGPWGEPISITQDLIARFAEVTGDHQWIHVDIERARRESPFQTTIAHGFLILSLVPVLRGCSSLSITGASGILNYGADKLRFISPVASGSQVHARSRLVDAAPKAKGTLVTHEMQVAVLGNENPAMIYRYLTLYLP